MILTQETIDAAKEALHYRIKHPGQLKWTTGTLFRVYRNYYHYPSPDRQRILMTDEQLNRLLYDAVAVLNEADQRSIGLICDLKRSTQTPSQLPSETAKPVRSQNTRSNRAIIEAMLDQGMERGAIAKELGIRYQAVYAVWKKKQG